MIYINEKHKEFYEINKENNNNFNSLIYLIGVSIECIKNINKIIDLKTKIIKPEVINEKWISIDDKKLLRAAFNLYTDKFPTLDLYKSKEEREEECNNYSLISLFSSNYAPYIYQALMIKFPEFTSSKSNFTERNAGRKPKFNDDDLEMMKELRNKGYTYQQIADEYKTTKTTILKTFKRI